MKVRSAMWQSGRKASCSSSLLERDEGVGVADLEDDVAVRQHRALGRAGGAGGVDQQGELVGLGARDQLLPQAGMGRVVLAAERQQLVERACTCGSLKSRQALHVEDEDLANVRAALAHLEELVELLVVLDEQEARAAVVQDVLDLLGGVGRIDAVGDAAGAHGAHVGVEPFGHRLGEDRDDLAALQPERDEAHADPPRALAVLAPRRGAPDAEVLLAEGGAGPVARLAPDARTAWGSCRSLRSRSARPGPPSRSPSSPGHRIAHVFAIAMSCASSSAAGRARPVPSCRDRTP